MKRKSAVIMMMAVAMLLFVEGCGKKSGTDTSEKNATQGLLYEPNNGSYVVKGYEGSEVNVIIPDTCNDVPVTEINRKVFENSDIQSIVIGKNVTKINHDAFNNCSLLKKVTLPDSLVTLSGFEDCISLEEIKIPASVENIGDSAFEGCSGLKKVDFSSNAALTGIGDDAFRGCTSLEGLEIPDTVTRIGTKPFAEMTSSQTVTFLGNTDEVKRVTVFGIEMPEMTITTTDENGNVTTSSSVSSKWWEEGSEANFVYK